MKMLIAGGVSVSAVAVAAAWLFFGVGQGADVDRSKLAADGAPARASGLVVHEWGTFTSFSGSDGVPVGFTPNNTDLPSFVYQQEGDPEHPKAERLNADGTVSMETPVLYFYSDKEMHASVHVDFPRGWITEWYPFAAAAPKFKDNNRRTIGQSIRWDVNLVPGQTARFPTEEKDNHYYQARETDAVAVQTEAKVQEQETGVLRGGTVIQTEKFLFYRGVGVFAPPLSAQALGNGKVEVKNNSGTRAAGLVLVTVHGGAVGFRTLAELEAKATTTAAIPAADKTAADLAAVMVDKLRAAGLYEKEARAMVKTWDSAWFGEEGTRLLYLVPRQRTDELLPLTVTPKPVETVRVLVGRHDFVTPEQEAAAERLVHRIRSAQAELQAAETDLGKTGRFAYQIRKMAEKRLDGNAAKK